MPVYLKDLWPTNAEIAVEVAKITGKMFQETMHIFLMVLKNGEQ